MNFIPKGVLPAMITPLTPDQKINEKALRKLITFLLDGGVHGIFAVGTTGEFYALSDEEYEEVLQITTDEVAGRVPVYAGANQICTRDAVRQAEIAQKAGVDAVSILTPYFISPNQNQIELFFKDIAASVDLPVLLYDNCPKTGVHIRPETAARLADVPNIVGMKDSTGDMTNTEECIRLTRDKDFHVMMGRDTLILPALACGAAGAVAACANAAPSITADIYNKYIEGDLDGAREAQFKLAPLRLAFGIGTFPAVIKESLRLQGIDVGDCFQPVTPLTDDERKRLSVILKNMGIL